MKYLLRPLRPYRDLFRGRASRKQFWLFQLGIILAAIGLVFAMFALVVAAGLGTVFYPADPVNMRSLSAAALAPLLGTLFLFSFAWFGFVLLGFAGIGMQVKRLHDQDLSGWLVLLGFIPYIGFLIMLVMMCLPGTRGPNRHGAEPNYDREPMNDLAERFA